MDHNMKLKSPSIHKKHFLKELIKLALSLSLFSILLSTWIIPCLSAISNFNFNSFDHHISTFPLRLLAHRVDKNHMFLLCNGILVYLAKSSGLIGESFRKRRRGGTVRTEWLWTNGEEGGWRPPELATLENEEGVLVFESETISVEMAKEVGGGNDNEDEDGEEIKEVCECCSDECREKGAGNDLGIRVEESEEEAEFDGDEDCLFEEGSEQGIMTAEELNRKFDEFIRKIREEISIGSAHVQKQQPVLG